MDAALAARPGFIFLREPAELAHQSARHAISMGAALAASP
eukprot:CAMPEP_0197621204 /NCGR_PEP_ID=MMETSP1338-20131121/1822_1 /TAXON_ID=43686 ORGANISM="Pelagodinium beii, Strain RCC1491" /NCGR_SAMPLE_ID=MMETSP1338 /ASSEMBLY_ACC=CAM_ASM_000754 /LENGTH=39 /DNA_ID= /DNA_START= /DNA_END= /DNA_ORIENTATION=